MKVNIILRNSILTAVALLGLPVFLLSTNPSALPLPLLVLPFILFFISCSAVVLLFVRFVLKKHDIFSRRYISISAILATIPTLLLVLQSLHQLTPKDILITVALVAAMIFYLVRLRIL